MEKAQPTPPPSVQHFSPPTKSTVLSPSLVLLKETQNRKGAKAVWMKAVSKQHTEYTPSLPPHPLPWRLRARIDASKTASIAHHSSVNLVASSEQACFTTSTPFHDGARGSQKLRKAEHGLDDLFFSQVFRLAPNTIDIFLRWRGGAQKG